MDIDLPSTALEAQFDDLYREINRRLAWDLLDRIKRAAPEVLERAALDLLSRMYCGPWGRGSCTLTGRSHDHGIDGIIRPDELGVYLIYFQVKRWNKPIGRPELQAFAGALDGQQTNQGFFITTSRFSTTAKKYISTIPKNISLIDGEYLAHLMIKYEVGVSTVAPYPLKKLAADYFRS